MNLGESLRYEFLLPLLQLPPVVYVTLAWALNWGLATAKRQKRFLDYLTEHYAVGVFHQYNYGFTSTAEAKTKAYKIHITIEQSENELNSSSTIVFYVFDSIDPTRPRLLLSRFTWDHYINKVRNLAFETFQHWQKIDIVSGRSKGISSVEFFDAIYDLYQPLRRK